jgi:hypothetical protein
MAHLPYIPGKQRPQRTNESQKAVRQKAVGRQKTGTRYVTTLKAGIARLDVCIIEALQLVVDLRAERDVCVKALETERAAHPERAKPCSSASWK